LPRQVAGVHLNPAAASFQPILPDHVQEFLMGIASISGTSMAGLLLAPLHALVGFFAPWQAAAAAPIVRNRVRQPMGHMDRPAQAAGLQPLPPAGRLESKALAAPLRPTCSRLRIVRVMDAGCSPHAAGRMMISGRMADVCAELDRMAQREAQGA
jgi:hypothetical protein